MGAPSCTCPWVYMAPSDAPSVPQPVKNGPKTVQRQAEAASVGQKWHENSPTGQNVSGSGQALPENSPAASGSGPALPENSPAASGSGKSDPKTVQRGKMLAEAAKGYPKTVQWGKLSGCGQVLGKMLAEAAKRYPKTVQRQAEAAKCYPKTVQRQAEAASVGQKWPENSPAGQNDSRSGQGLPENSPVGIIERMRPSVGKNVSGSGQALPENSPAASGSGQALPENSPAASGSSKRWAKVFRKQSNEENWADAAKCWEKC